MFRRAITLVALLSLTGCTLPEGFGQDLWDAAKLTAQAYAEAELARQPDAGSPPAPAEAPAEAPATSENGEQVEAEETPPAEPSEEPPAETPATPAARAAPKLRRSEELRLLALRALRNLGQPK